MLGGSCCGSAQSGNVASVSLDEHTGKINQSASGCNLGNIVESTLPSDVSCLVVLRERSHINAVGSHVMSGAAEGDDGKQGYTYGEEIGQMQSQCHKSEDASGGYLCEYHEKLLGFVDLEERAPEGLQRPRKHDDGRPESNLRITHVQSLEHKRTYHVEYHERHSHGEVERRHPRDRATTVLDIRFH